MSLMRGHEMFKIYLKRYLAYMSVPTLCLVYLYIFFVNLNYTGCNRDTKYKEGFAMTQHSVLYSILLELFPKENGVIKKNIMLNYMFSHSIS
jgi:hypothetical protein